MTSETRTLIELTDLAGVEVQCSECQYLAVFPIGKVFKIGSRCPQCEHVWFDELPNGREGGRHPAIDNLQKIASELRSLTRKDRTDIHASVRLHISTKLPE
jgi:hypothetical protein